MDNELSLKFCKKLWHIFPTYTLYKTSRSNSLLPKEEDVIYVYSLSKISNPFYKQLETSSNCFEIYQFFVEGFKEPVGFVIIPTLPIHYIIRYTPLILMATHPDSTSNTLEHSTRKMIYSNNWIELIRLSNGVEFITHLGHTMDINLI